VEEEEILASGDLARLRERIEAWQEPAGTLLEVRVAGILPAEDSAEIGRIEELLASRFLHGRLEASRLRPAPQDDRWVAGLPAGLLRDVGSRLQALADPAFAGDRPEGASPETAARALLELYALRGREGKAGG